MKKFVWQDEKHTVMGEVTVDEDIKYNSQLMTILDEQWQDLLPGDSISLVEVYDE